MLKEELIKKINTDINLFKALTDAQKIEYIDYLKTASHSVLNTFQAT
jgi:hypothetical protein